MTKNSHDSSQQPIESKQVAPPVSLRKNFSWALVGNVTYAACQWGILVVLSKFGSVEMVGLFTLGLSITAPIIQFTNLQLRSILATDTKQNHSFADYFGVRIFTTVVGIFLLFIVVMVPNYSSYTRLIIILIGVSKGFEAFSDIFWGLFQQHERMDKIAKSQIVRGILTVLLIVLILSQSQNLSLAVGCMALFWGGHLWWYDIGNGKKELCHLSSTMTFCTCAPRFNVAILTQLIRFSLPMGVIALLTSLNINIPRYIIEAKLGIEQLGIFSALSYVMVAENIIVNALGQSIIHKMAVAYIEKQRGRFYRLLMGVCAVSIIIGIGGTLFVAIAGERILTILYAPLYAQYHQIFLLLMIAAIIINLVSLINYALTATRSFMSQLYLSIFSAVCMFLVSVWLIPVYGLKGASFSILIIAVLQILGSLFVLCRRVEMNCVIVNDVVVG